MLQRWTSTHSTARLAGLNSLFQAASARRSTAAFITMVYLIAAPIQNLLNSI